MIGKEFYIIEVSVFYNNMNYSEDYKMRFNTQNDAENYIQTILKNEKEDVDYNWNISKVVCISKGKFYSKIGMHEIKNKNDFPCYDRNYVFFFKDGTSKEMFFETDDNDNCISIPTDIMENIIGWREL